MDSVIKGFYNNYQEEMRLLKDNAHKTEFLTSIKFIKESIPKKSTVLDACAGTGAYAFELAECGYEVTAGDFMEKHVLMMRKINEKKQTLKNVVQTNVLDLSQFKDNSFDAVLCMGALYHLFEHVNRQKAISECLRVLKPKGIFVAAYINRYAKTLKDMLKVSDLQEAVKELESGNCCANCPEEPFYLTTPSEFENEIKKFNLTQINNIGSDGIAYALADKINHMPEDQYKSWLEYHIKTCSDPYILGYSLHGLYIGQKR